MIDVTSDCILVATSFLTATSDCILAATSFLIAPSDRNIDHSRRIGEIASSSFGLKGRTMDYDGGPSNVFPFYEVYDGNDAVSFF